LLHLDVAGNPIAYRLRSEIQRPLASLTLAKVIIGLFDLSNGSAVAFKQHYRFQY
jgi:hypothetical protein